jgi:hypothetical protein
MQGKPAVKQVIYVSTQRVPFQRAALDKLLAAARQRNVANGITGYLFYNGHRFLQALEGEGAAVDATLARIKNDERHYALVVLSERQITRREFAEWSMGFEEQGFSTAGLLAAIEHATADAGANTRALFRTFVDASRVDAA